MSKGAARQLLACMTELGKRQSNAVLMSLAGAESIRPYQRYPSQPFYFADGSWRVYYHCHDADGKDAREYGHFHFFTRTSAEGTWSHVVAMGINQVGLPISLFTTNLWVTDGAWFECDMLDQQLHLLQTSDDGELPLPWFKYMLLLYQDDLQLLLHERDRRLAALCPLNEEQCFTDRDIYLLSYMEIDVQQQLFSVLHGEQMKPTQYAGGV